jgi:two-component system response regulator FlrC
MSVSQETTPVVEPVAVAPGSRRLIELARRVADTDCTVLITGESGTGKEVLARFIHRQSPRSQRPFVAVNCAAIPESMLEGVLFGFEKGAFTGAQAAHAGKFEQAQGGTLLLDEITEMPIALQAKLLRVLQEREVDRIGGRVPVQLDVRVIATSNRKLAEEVRAGRFREDLYYRINVFPLSITPLRERREDILPIAAQILAAQSRGQLTPVLAAGAVQALQLHSWPGNARELGNVLQRALILGNGSVIERDCIELDPVFEPLRITPVVAVTRNELPMAAGSDVAYADVAHTIDGRSAFARQRDQAEREILLSALRDGRGKRTDVAQRLGISPRTLRYKLARLRAAGVEVPA